MSSGRTDWSSFRSISSGELPRDADRPPPAKQPAKADSELLDAYSQAVINVAETVAPAVISLTSRREDGRGGSGSGFLITPDGYAVTNSHVVDGRPRLSAQTVDGDAI